MQKNKAFLKEKNAKALKHTIQNPKKHALFSFLRYPSPCQKEVSFITDA